LDHAKIPSQTFIFFDNRENHTALRLIPENGESAAFHLEVGKKQMQLLENASALSDDNGESGSRTAFSGTRSTYFSYHLSMADRVNGMDSAG
jgi:hypothetical protein